MSEDKIHIVIAESAPIISTGLAHTLSHLEGIPARVLEIKSPSDLPECLRSQEPQLLVVNPFFGGRFDPAEMRRIHPDVKIMAIETGPIHRDALALFDDSLSVADDLDTISEKIRRMIQTDRPEEPEKEPLSSREKEIISLVVKGLTNKEIAEQLFLSVHTVITHRRNIARKLEIHSATGLTIYAIVNKLVDIAELRL